jgi:O-antigen/teichoic acid export membrane protein
MNVVSVIFGPIIYILNMIDLQFYVKNVIFFSILINIILNYMLIPKFGIEGAATATLISTIFWKSLLFIKLKRTIKTLKKQSYD